MDTPVRLLMGLGLGAVLLAHTVGAAQAFPPDVDTLQYKGYSPAVVQATRRQRLHQEWRQPVKRKYSPVGMFFRNIWYNEYTGSLDPFGEAVIRTEPY